MRNHELEMPLQGLRAPWAGAHLQVVPDEVVAEDTGQRLPEVCFAIGVGIFLVAIGDTAARYGYAWAQIAFWAGILAMFGAVAVRLSNSPPSRREGLGMAVALGFGLYLARVVHGPIGMTSFDEFIHFRTSIDVFRTGHLYAQNPILPVSSVYPGLEIVSTALAHVTGLGLFASGVIVVGAARLVHIAALFLVFAVASRSDRVATIATVLFTASSTFFYFDAQYAYESLALPLGVLLLLLATRVTRPGEPRRDRIGFGVLTTLTALALTVTHHVTALVFGAVLVAWALVHSRRARRIPGEGSPGWIGLVLLVAAAAWTVLVAGVVLTYLGHGPLGTAIQHIPGISKSAATRRPFEAANGSTANLDERAIALVGTLLTVVGLCVTLPLYWRRPRRSSLGIVLAGLAALYPFSLALRLLPGGWEISNRASGFLFLGVAFVLAAGLVEGRFRGRLRRLADVRGLLIGAFLVIVPISGILIGTDALGRLPGPYAVAAGARSIEPRGITAAEWARGHLPPASRVAADRTNTLLMASYGDERVITDLSDHVDLSPLFLAPTVAAWQRSIIRGAKIRYLVVDRRIGGSVTPPDGFFYEPWELQALRGAYTGQKGVDPRSLVKYDRVPGVDRVFDNGSIVIYDVGALRGSS